MCMVARIKVWVNNKIMFERFKKEHQPTIIDGVEVPPMGALAPYDYAVLGGIYVPTPEWIGFDDSEFTDEQKAAIVKQFEIPPDPTVIEE